VFFTAAQERTTVVLEEAGQAKRSTEQRSDVQGTEAKNDAGGEDTTPESDVQRDVQAPVRCERGAARNSRTATDVRSSRLTDVESPGLASLKEVMS
jgi:hypothetical protein